MKRKELISINKLEDNVRRTCKLRIKDLERYKTKLQIKVNRLIHEYSDYVNRVIKDINFDYDFYKGLPKTGDAISVEKWIQSISDLQALINKYNVLRGVRIGSDDEQYYDETPAEIAGALTGLMNALYWDLMVYASLEQDQEYHRNILVDGGESVKKVKNDLSIVLNKYFKNAKATETP